MTVLRHCDQSRDWYRVLRADRGTGDGAFHRLKAWHSADSALSLLQKGKATQPLRLPCAGLLRTEETGRSEGRWVGITNAAP